MNNRELLKQGALQLGITLSEEQLDQFFIYHKLRVEWNQKMNLTAITEERDVVIKHFLDCLSGASIIREIEGASVADIGTGAGFPGMVLKIVLPDHPFVLIDSLNKRITFLETVVRELGLQNVQLIHGRAEELAHVELHREKYDVVVSRAVAAMPVLLEYSLGYVKKNGIFLAYKGPALEQELEDAQHALKVLKARVESAVQAEIPYGDYSHTLAVIRKYGEISKTYPRSQAKIKKMPL